MNFTELLAPLSTAFFAGLLGAGHCFGMCGGIASGLGVTAARKGAFGAALVFNGSRIISYALLGGIAALILGFTGEALSLPSWSRWLRWATAILIALVGFQFLFGLRFLSIIERGGARLWARISPMVQKLATLRGAGGRVALGLAWGFLPCGLVYTLLLTAASMGNFSDGALVMLAFGFGTLPALLGMTLWAPALANLLQDRMFRRAIGIALILLAAWSVLIMGSMDHGMGEGVHQH
ncbi:MAG TPA: sulfite exporter TauE/SafE family protein [Xanthomonadales bacterium]|nr:sulfite exporter TauE/SafE family protein [Xanthomonadales bacterium]